MQRMAVPDFFNPFNRRCGSGMPPDPCINEYPGRYFFLCYVYILIIFLGIPFTFLYNILAAIIRSLGDSKTPVIFLAMASIINIILDIVFILVFHMGVEGPALATVISQAVSGGVRCV